jgi:hypothetical protein
MCGDGAATLPHSSGLESGDGVEQGAEHLVSSAENLRVHLVGPLTLDHAHDAAWIEIALRDGLGALVESGEPTPHSFLGDSEGIGESLG